MSREIRITIDDDEVFERLRRRKDALDLSWEDALRRGLREGTGPRPAPKSRPEREQGRYGRGTTGNAEGRHGRAGPGGKGGSRGRRSGSGSVSPFDSHFGEQIARDVISSVNASIPGVDVALEDEIGRLEDAEDAVLILGDGEHERIPLRVALQTGPDGLDVEVIAVRSGKGTEGLNRFEDGARADVARRFAEGDTATLEIEGSEETYEVRPELTWVRGHDGVPTVTDVAIREVVFGT